MNFGHNKTKLDYIMELGFRRIDEAVERVIWNHKADILLEEIERHLKDALTCEVDVRPRYEFNKVPSMSALLNMRQSTSLERQRQYNASQTGMVNMFAVGQQSAVGSPDYILGAAYRQSRGFL